MKRDGYQIFSQGRIGPMTVPNRLVRSSTWDPCIHRIRRVTDEVMDLYRGLASGGVGLIITGGLPVYRERFPGEDGIGPRLYSDLSLEGIDTLAEAVHSARPGCKIVAQLEVGHLSAGP